MPACSRGATRPSCTWPLARSGMRGRREDRGRPGARCTRGPVCNGTRKCAHEHTGPAESIRPSLRNGLTAYGALFPETNSSCLRHRRIDDFANPVGLRENLRRFDTSHGCQNHTLLLGTAQVRLCLPYASRYVSRRGRGNGTEVGHGPSGSAAPPRSRCAAIRGYDRGRPQPPACRRGCSGRLSSWMRSSMTDFRPSLERWQGSQRRQGRRERNGIGGCFGRA
jgi:hypothetical protein